MALKLIQRQKKTVPTLNECFPEWKSGKGFFTAFHDSGVYDFPWENKIDNVSIDNAYHLRSGSKPVLHFEVNESKRPYIGLYTYRAIASKYGLKWKKLFDTLYLEYNPISNYDMTETELTNSTANGTTTGTQKSTTTGTSNTDTTQTNKYGQTNTTNGSGSANTSTESSNNSGTINGLYPNAYGGSSHNTDKSDITSTSNTGTTQNTSNTTTSTNGGADTQETELKTGTSSTSNGENSSSANSTGKVDRTLTRSGNIGVTTSQQMIESERNLWMWNFLETVFEDVDNEIFLKVYGLTDEEAKKYETQKEYVLPTASATVLGGVKIGDNLSINSNGVLSAKTGTEYTAGDNVTIKDGKISVEFPTASDIVAGVVRVSPATDEQTQTVGIRDGKLYVSQSGGGGGEYTLPEASTSVLGGVKVSTSSLKGGLLDTVMMNGTIYAKNPFVSPQLIFTFTPSSETEMILNYNDNAFTSLQGYITENDFDMLFASESYMSRRLLRGSIPYETTIYNNLAQKNYIDNVVGGFFSIDVINKGNSLGTFLQIVFDVVTYDVSENKTYYVTAYVENQITSYAELGEQGSTVLTKTAETVVLPIASTNALGGVKIGDGITISDDGTISTSGTTEIPEATTEVLGGVRISTSNTKGTQLETMVRHGVLYAQSPFVSPYQIYGFQFDSETSVNLGYNTTAYNKLTAYMTEDEYNTLALKTSYDAELLVEGTPDNVSIYNPMKVGMIIDNIIGGYMSVIVENDGDGAMSLRLIFDAVGYNISENKLYYLTIGRQHVNLNSYSDLGETGYFPLSITEIVTSTSSGNASIFTEESLMYPTIKFDGAMQLYNVDYGFTSKDFGTTKYLTFTTPFSGYQTIDNVASVPVTGMITLQVRFVVTSADTLSSATLMSATGWCHNESYGNASASTHNFSIPEQPALTYVGISSGSVLRLTGRTKLTEFFTD